MSGYSICYNKWLDDNKIKNELRLLLRISSLTALEGYCYASNKYFSKKLSETPENISRKIKKLEKLEYINIKYEYRGCEVKKRKITLANTDNNLNTETDFSIYGSISPRLTKLSIDDQQKYQSTIDQNVKDNITSINNIREEEEYIFCEPSLKDKESLHEGGKKESQESHREASESKEKEAPSQSPTPPENLLNSPSEDDKKPNKRVSKGDVESFYLQYPTRCPISGRATGKTRKNSVVDKIKSVIREHGLEVSIKTIKNYIKDCEETNTFIKNFVTFLNNFPDPESFTQSQAKIAPNQWKLTDICGDTVQERIDSVPEFFKNKYSLLQPYTQSEYNADILKWSGKDDTAKKMRQHSYNQARLHNAVKGVNIKIDKKDLGEY